MSAPRSDLTRSTRSYRARSAAVVALLTIVAAVAAGCTDQTEPEGGSTAAPSDAAPAVTPAPDRTTVDDEGGVGAHADLQKPLCAAQNGVWGFTGVVKNAARTAQVYTVEVSVVNPDGWSVVGTKSIEVRAEADKAVPVRAAAFHRESAADAAKHQCVTRVVRHQG